MIATYSFRYFLVLLIAYCLSLISACADLNVTKVTDANQATVKGVRYYLPKPYLLATPQADGTVIFDVVFLPDKSREYAIDTSAYFSNYTFQVARDEKGLLTALEFKASTSAVGQQLATSVGNSAAQAYNIKAAGLAAVQSQVNTAQTALDTAKANAAADEAKLASDQGNPNVSSATITSDYAAVAQSKAKLQIAEQALQRAQSNSQAVATTIAASTTASTTAPTMGTAFGAQAAWSLPTVYNLPDKFGPVLYAINDKGSAVTLVAVQAELPGTILEEKELQHGVHKEAQRTFETTSTALGPPSLFPSELTISLTAKQAIFYFNRPIKSPLTIGSSVTTDETPPKATTAVLKAASDGKSVTIDITSLKAGKYIVTTKFSYPADSREYLMSGTKQVKLTITP
jgi:hypothetical protein